MRLVIRSCTIVPSRRVQQDGFTFSVEPHSTKSARHIKDTAKCRRPCLAAEISGGFPFRVALTGWYETNRQRALDGWPVATTCHHDLTAKLPRVLFELALEAGINRVPHHGEFLLGAKSSAHPFRAVMINQSGA